MDTKSEDIAWRFNCCFFRSILNFVIVIRTSNQQLVINQDLNGLNAKVGSFESITANTASIHVINITCPPGKNVTGIWEMGASIYPDCK